jgi:hypothetical protein
MSPRVLFLYEVSRPFAVTTFLVLFILAVALLRLWLSRLFQRKDIRRARDPDTPAAELLALAEHNPEVLENPALPLLALEDPLRWSEIRVRAERTDARRRKALQLYLRAFLPLVILLVLIVLVWLIRHR